MSLKTTRLRWRRRRRSWRGFTLVETIVTVGLLAVLAAFIVPTVIQKAGVADPVKVQNDLGSVRTALETFGSDLRGVYPADLEDLANPITTADSTVSRVPYSGGQVSSWKGPYFAVVVPETDNTTANAAKVRTGFGADISAVLQRYDATNDKGEISGGTGTTFSTSGMLYVAVKITGLSLAQAQDINSLVDGSSDADQPVSGSVTAGTNTTGRLRYTTSSGTTTVYYLATPLATP